MFLPPWKILPFPGKKSADAHGANPLKKCHMKTDWISFEVLYGMLYQRQTYDSLFRTDVDTCS